MSPMVNFRAGNDLDAAIRAEAQRSGQTRSEVIRRLVQAGLDLERAPEVPTDPPDGLDPERHLHRYVATGAFRHELGQRIDERKCACGDVSWA